MRALAVFLSFGIVANLSLVAIAMTYSADERRRATSVEAHVGSAGEFLERHEMEVYQALVEHTKREDDVSARLFSRITDDRNLWLACQRIRRRGGNAAGPDGIHPQQLDSDECRSLCRLLKRITRDLSYRPGSLRTIDIPKPPPKHGTRQIQIANFADRVVARAIYQILAPWYEPMFADCSYGFRSRRGAINALADAQRQTLGSARPFWVVADIRDAFGSVPRQRLLQVLAMRLPEDVVRLVNIVCGDDHKRGIPQGNALSPLLLNIYLDHFLDRRWRHSYSLLRYADDVLLLGSDRREAEHAHAELLRLLDPAGMPVKDRDAPNIVDLRQGAATWLGYECRIDGTGNFAVSIPDNAWQSLQERIAVAVRKDRNVFVALRSWGVHYGLCQEFDDLAGLRRQLNATVASVAPHRFLISRKQVHNWRFRSRKLWTDALVRVSATRSPPTRPWPVADTGDAPF